MILVHTPLASLYGENVVAWVRRALLDISFERRIFFEQTLLYFLWIYFFESIQGNTNIDRLLSLKRWYDLAANFIRNMADSCLKMIIPTWITNISWPVSTFIILFVIIIAYFAEQFLRLWLIAYLDFTHFYLNNQIICF